MSPVLTGCIGIGSVAAFVIAGHTGQPNWVMFGLTAITVACFVHCLWCQ